MYTAPFHIKQVESQIGVLKMVNQHFPEEHYQIQEIRKNHSMIENHFEI